MKKIKLTSVVGLLAGATLVYFNVRHALNDYGIRDNAKLHPEIMAQAGTTNGSGSGSGSGGVSTNAVPRDAQPGKWDPTQPRVLVQVYQDPSTKQWYMVYNETEKFSCVTDGKEEAVCGSIKQTRIIEPADAY